MNVLGVFEQRLFIQFDITINVYHIVFERKHYYDDLQEMPSIKY